MNEESIQPTAPVDATPSRSERLKVALLYGSQGVVMLIPVAVVAWLVLGRLLPGSGLGSLIAKRLTFIALMMSLTTFVSRWFLIPKFGTRPLWIHVKDWSAWGFIAGLLLTGYVTEARMTSPDTVMPGEVVKIEGTKLDGTHFDLQEWKGKVVLVDFWATWCGPCVAELPNVKTVYDKYHDKGFEIVSISFDNNRGELEKFVEKNNMRWPQLFEEDPKEQGFDNPNGVRYSVNGIPMMMLVDQEGKLIAKGLRGSAVDIAVRRALGVSPPWTTWLAEQGWRVFNWLWLAIIASRWYIALGICCSLAWLGTALQLKFAKPQKLPTESVA